MRVDPLTAIGWCAAAAIGLIAVGIAIDWAVERRRVSDRRFRRAVAAIDAAYGEGLLVTADVVPPEMRDRPVVRYQCFNESCRHESPEGAAFCLMTRHEMRRGIKL